MGLSCCSGVTALLYDLALRPGHYTLPSFRVTKSHWTHCPGAIPGSLPNSKLPLSQQLEEESKLPCYSKFQPRNPTLSSQGLYSLNPPAISLSWFLFLSLQLFSPPPFRVNPFPQHEDLKPSTSCGFLLFTSLDPNSDCQSLYSSTLSTLTSWLCTSSAYSCSDGLHFQLVLVNQT